MTVAVDVKEEAPKKGGIKSALRALSPGRTRDTHTPDTMTVAVDVKEEGPKKGGIKSALRALSPGRTREPPADDTPPKKDTTVDDSKDDGEKSSRGKTWRGAEKKKPRAEYQTEIDDLRAKLEGLAGVEADRDRQVARVYQLTQEVNTFKTWVQQAPRVS